MRRFGIAIFIATTACGHVAGPGPDAAVDARGGADAAADVPSGAPVVPPVLVASAGSHADNAMTALVSLTVPEGDNRFLLVWVGVGSNCADATVPTIQSVAYAGLPLTRVTTNSGTPCGPTVTRSEQWQLTSPGTGAHDIVVMLSAAAVTVHLGALALTGVNQTTPVRASATGSGKDVAASVVVDSAPDDLVVSTVGQGFAVTGPGTGQTAAYIVNATRDTTLDNSAASTAPGAAPVVAMNWTFAMSDEWQMIVSSIEPAAPQ